MMARQHQWPVIWALGLISMHRVLKIYLAHVVHAPSCKGHHQEREEPIIHQKNVFVFQWLTWHLIATPLIFRRDRETATLGCYISVLKGLIRFKIIFKRTTVQLTQLDFLYAVYSLQTNKIFTNCSIIWYHNLV